MIWCDDSGWGSLLGGVMIGVYDDNTRKFRAKLIPPSFFQGRKWTEATYRQEATKVFIEMWIAMGEIRQVNLCRGTVLDGIYQYLEYKGIGPRFLQRVEIKDPLQGLLEEKFAESLAKIGVPRTSAGAHCLSFNEQVNWLKEDPKRIKYAKTGWPSWKQKYEKLVRSK